MNLFTNTNYLDVGWQYLPFYDYQVFLKMSRHARGNEMTTEVFYRLVSPRVFPHVEEVIVLSLVMMSLTWLIHAVDADNAA